MGQIDIGPNRVRHFPSSGAHPQRLGTGWPGCNNHDNVSPESDVLHDEHIPVVDVAGRDPSASAPPRKKTSTTRKNWTAMNSSLRGQRAYAC